MACVDARQQRQPQQGPGSSHYNQVNSSPPSHLGMPGRWSDICIKQHSALKQDSTRASRIKRPHTSQNNRLESQACSMQCHKQFQAGHVFELHHDQFHTTENSKVWSRLQMHSSLFRARHHDAAHHTSKCYSWVHGNSSVGLPAQRHAAPSWLALCGPGGSSRLWHLAAATAAASCCCLRCLWKTVL